MLNKQGGLAHLGIVLVIIILAVIGFAGWKVWQTNKSSSGGNTSAILRGGGSALDKAIKAGKMLSSGKCEGTEKVKLTALPMKESDFSIVIPYGLMVGGHVTPIDHQYFGPADYKSPRDAYPVYAMADSMITDIQPRTTERGVEYRFVFTVSCTSLYYYDLVTSLTGKTKQAYDSRKFDVRVKAGELIGAIGGQTLDFAVWDTEKPLTGFINPANYDGEAWKIYTADPYPFYTPKLRQLLIDRNPRVVEPIAGRIDYDVDGKLIGNWFAAGTGGYHAQGNNDPEYWGGHLSVSPDHWDPSGFIISIGDFDGEAKQFAEADNSPYPDTVSPETGLVKYDLRQISYKAPDGSYWNGNLLIKGPKLVANQYSVGCFLVQMTGKRSLKAESFPRRACSSVTDFSSAAKTYER